MAEPSIVIGIFNCAYLQFWPAAQSACTVFAAQSTAAQFTAVGGVVAAAGGGLLAFLKLVLPFLKKKPAATAPVANTVTANPIITVSPHNMQTVHVAAPASANPTLGSAIDHGLGLPRQQAILLIDTLQKHHKISQKGAANTKKSIIEGKDADKNNIRKILELIAQDKDVSLSVAKPIFDKLELSSSSPYEVVEEAISAINAINTKAKTPVVPSNQGADIDATIGASRKALKQEGSAAAIAILQSKRAEEEQTRYQRLAPLLAEEAEMHQLVFDWAAAISAVQKLLTLAEAAMGPEHSETREALDRLATLFYTKGDYTAAKPLYERALAIAEKTLGPEHPSTGTSLNNLARLLYAQGDYTAAKPLYERALAIAEKTLGPEHPSTGTSLNNLAGLLDAQGDYSAAKPLYERALAIAEKSLGPEHPSTGTSLNNLAVLLGSQGDYNAAKPLFERALAIAQKAEGPEHPSTAASLNNLAGLLESQGDYNAAKPLYERALAIAEKSLGPEHPNTKTCRKNLSALQALIAEQ